MVLACRSVVRVSGYAVVLYFSTELMLTCPCPLVAEEEAGALWVRAADVGRLCGIMHRQHTRLVIVGWPASVFHIPSRLHAFHYGIFCTEERGEKNTSGSTLVHTSQRLTQVCSKAHLLNISMFSAHKENRRLPL